MMFGGLAIIFGGLIHWLLPESVRFLLEKGQTAKAQKESDRVKVEEVQPLQPVYTSNQLTKEDVDKSVPGLWSRRYAHITLSLWVLWISLNFLYQGVFVWLPTLLAEGSNSVDRSFLLTLFISLGKIPGILLIAYLADRFSWQRLIILSLGLLGCTVV